MSAPCTCTIDSDGNFVTDDCYWNDEDDIRHVVAATRRIDGERAATTAQEDPALAPYPEDEWHDLIVARDRVRAHRANFDLGDTRRTHWDDGFSCGWHARKLRTDAERQAVPTDAPTGTEIMGGYKEWADQLDPRAAAGMLSGFRAGVAWLLARGLPTPEPVQIPTPLPQRESEPTTEPGPLLVADCGCELWVDGLAPCDATRPSPSPSPSHIWYAFQSAFRLRPSSHPPELLRWANELGTTPEVLLGPGVCNYVGEARGYLHQWVDGDMQVTATLTETP